MKEPQRRCTPLVVFEVQLWPQPLEPCEPYWWGYHNLTFYALDKKGNRVPRKDSNEFVRVRDRRIPESAWGNARAFRDPIRGWCLRIEIRHESAHKVLHLVGLRNPPGEDSDLPFEQWWRLMPWACAHTRDDRRSDGSCKLCGQPPTARSPEALGIVQTRRRT